MLLPEIFIAEPRETSHSSFFLHHSTFRHPSLPQTPSLPDADSRSDRFRCGGRESKFLQTD
jgi:hypothetical protein